MAQRIESGDNIKWPSSKNKCKIGKLRKNGLVTSTLRMHVVFIESFVLLVFDGVLRENKFRLFFLRDQRCVYRRVS